MDNLPTNVEKTGSDGNMTLPKNVANNMDRTYQQ